MSAMNAAALPWQILGIALMVAALVTMIARRTVGGSFASMILILLSMAVTALLTNADNVGADAARYYAMALTAQLVNIIWLTAVTISRIGREMKTGGRR